MYVNSNSVDDTDDFVKDLHQQVVALNGDSDWRDALMTWEEMLDEKLEEGFESGFEKGMKEGVKEGAAKGEEKGYKKGVKDGIEQGAQQDRNHLLAKLVASNKLSYNDALTMSDDSDELNRLIAEANRRSEPFMPDYQIEPDYPF